MPLPPLLRNVALFITTLSVLLLAWPAGAATDAEPPGRVARLSHLDGTVSFAPADGDDWVSAVRNRPLTGGDRLWVEQSGRAELHVGATALRLAGGTGIEILRLNDEDLRVRLSQGTLSLRVRDYPDGEEIEIATPNIGFVLSEPGEYRIDVDADRDTTTVSVRRGAGKAYGADEARTPQRIGNGQRLRFDGEDLFVLETGSVGPRDEFERWAAQRDDREDASRSTRYVSREMTGYEDLDAYGDWREDHTHGWVWVPRITISGWAPYHHGHWAWVAPWGWTWIDDAPWGFAPFHYGRWAFIGGYWSWVPGPRVARPAYAPALVAFVGGSSSGVSWSISLSSGLAGVAWFPLGPGEPYRPAWAHRPAYLERLNPHIDHRAPPPRYANQQVPHAVAVLPERDFARGVAVRPGQQPAWRGDAGQLKVHDSLPLVPRQESRLGGAEPRREAPPAFRQPATGRDGDAGRLERRVEPTRQMEPRRDERQFDQRQRDDQQRAGQRRDEQRRQMEQRQRDDQQRTEQRQQEQRRMEQEQNRQRDEQRRQVEQRQRDELQRAEQQRRHQEPQRRPEEQRRQIPRSPDREGRESR